MQIKTLFDKPKIISVIADVNTGKSNLIYYLISKLQEHNKFSLYTYGLKTTPKGAIAIHSVNEMETIRDSVLVIDEMMTLFDLDNRKAKKSIENTLRLINHNNNILLLCGLGENFKKFLSGKIDVFIYKQVKFDDLINGSKVKQIIMDYKGVERGTTILNLSVDEALVFDNTHYRKISVPYMEEYDSKKGNVTIIVPNNAEGTNCGGKTK